MVDIAIEVTDRKGRISQLAGTEGLTLMDALKSQGLPVAATCGGAKSCATSHVYIGEGSPPLDLPHADEAGPLSAADHNRPTGHVYTGEGPPPLDLPDEDEVDLLSESDHYREGVSRLSCQIVLVPTLGGLHVELAPQD